MTPVSGCSNPSPLKYGKGEPISKPTMESCGSKATPELGKSTLMKHALLYCQEKFKDDAIAYYFFNARGATLERSPSGMLQSLMIQLLVDDSYIQERFIAHFLNKKRERNEST